MSADIMADEPNLARYYREHIAAMCARYDHALEGAGAMHAVIYSGAPKTAFLDDNQYPFKANPHFLSWVPLTRLPHSCIVYTPGEPPTLVYYMPRDYWHVVPGEPHGYWTDCFQIRVVHSLDAVRDALPADREKVILIGETDEASSTFRIARTNPAVVMNVLHFARGVKTPYELDCMRLASRRAAAGHAAAEQAFFDGLSEFDIHRAYCAAVSHTDNELPYENIVALNDHGAVLHYTNLERTPPVDRHSFLIDAGAQVNGYAADITRTYSYQDKQFAELIERMEKAQLEIVGRVRSGVDYAELHIEAHRILGGVLADAGMAIGNPEALLETGVTSAFFPHGLGHLLGIQVHDIGGFMLNESGTAADPPSGHPYLRLTRALEDDMVLTIEPGIYVIDMLLDGLRDSPAEQLVNWQAVDWMRPFGGIRIEDDIRVMADGCENLTRDAFAAIC
jgi:Xaa-Pro dipeptidase